MPGSEANLEAEAANARYDKAQDRMRLLPNYYRWIFSTFSSYVSGRTLELGAGAGHLIPFYVDAVDHVYALDFHAVLLKELESRFGGAQVTAIAADMRGDFSGALPQAVDTILALDVLEHFEDDSLLVARAAAVLSSRGHMIVKVPANRALFGDTDRASGHFRRYDPEQLRAVMKSAGLEEVSLTYFNRPGALAYRRRRNRKTNFSRTFHPAVLRGVNLAIPFIAALDQVMRNNGLSLIGVYKKR